MGWFWKKHKIRNTCLGSHVKRNKLLLNFQIRILLVRAAGLPLLAVAELLEKRGYYNDIFHLHSSIRASNSKAFSTWRGGCGQRDLENPPATACVAQWWWWSDAPEAGGGTKANFGTPTNHPGKERGWPALPSTWPGFDLPIYWESLVKNGCSSLNKPGFYPPCNFCPNLVPSFINSSWAVLNYWNGVKMKM